MKVKILFYYYLLFLIFIVTFPVPTFSYDYFIKNLTSIIKSASHIVEAEVLDVKQTLDKHKSPICVITLKVNEVIVGKPTEQILTLKFLILDYDGAHRPLNPKFKVGEKVILHLKKYNNDWIILGHNQGKYVITGNTIEWSNITVNNFKQQIKNVASMQSNTIEVPPQKNFYESIGDYSGEGISKLGGEFHLLYPLRYGPTNGVIEFHINPVNAKDKDGNPISFNDIKDAVERAINSWNNVTHSYLTFTVASSPTNSSRGYNDGISTITFEPDNLLQGSNGATYTFYSNGIINEVDIIFNSDNRWNTNTIYPSNYSLYIHPSHGQIGPVDLEDVAAHELGHGIWLHHVGDNYSTYTLYPTNYEASLWWEKTWRRSLELGDRAGKIYQDPYFPNSTILQNQKILLSAPITTNFNGNLIVPSNYLLQLESGKIFNLNYNSISSSSSTINIEDGATIHGLRAKLKNTYSSNYKGLFSTVQAAINNAGQLDEIHIVGGPYNENLNISNKNSISIYSGTINGTITATNSLGLQIFGTECNSIYLNNCTFPVFNNVNIYGSGSGTGLSLYNTDYNPGNMFNTMVWNFTTGFYASNSWCYLNSGNIFYENSSAVVSAYNSNLSLYYNELCNASGYHLTAGYGGYIYALECYYDNGIPRIFQNYGTVEINGANVCTLPKRSSTAKNINTEIINKPVEGEFKEINNMLYDLSNRVNDDIKQSKKFNKDKFYDEYISVTNILKNYIERNTDSNLLGAALTTAVHCFRRIEDYESMKDFLEGIKSNTSLRREVRNLAKRYVIDYYSKKGDFPTALSIADEIIKEEKSNVNFVNDVLYAKGLIYAHNLKEENKAKECFNEIVKNSSDNNLIELAENQLKLLGYEIENEKKETANKISSPEIEISNYPNPFNPSTVISYQLPERNLVTIKVYDILGGEVATLVNEYQDSGSYKVEFSADEYQLSSGIYFYAMKAGKNYIVRKMILTK